MTPRKDWQEEAEAHEIAMAFVCVLGWAVCFALVIVELSR